MAQSKARALRMARVGHTPEWVRLVRQEQTIKRTTMHIRYDIGKTVYQEPGLGTMRSSVTYRIVKRSPTGSKPVMLDRKLPS